MTTDSPVARISPEEVAKVAKLARLSLTDSELDRFTHQLSDILDHAAELSELDLDGIEPLAHPIPLENVMRDDVVGPLLDRDEVLACAPATEGGRFSVPPVLGEAI